MTHPLHPLPLPPDLILVLGMHRAGTSSVTRGLQAAGVALGDNLIAGNEGNPTGYWEDLDFNEFNAELLRALGRDWHWLEYTSASDVELLVTKGYLERGLQLLGTKLVSPKPLALKDPRTAKLLPFWREVIRASHLRVAFVLVTRHPMSVAKSLIQRDRFAAEKCFLLWLEHMVVSLAHTTDSTCVVVDYDDMINSPETQLRRIAQVFGLHLQLSELKEYKEQFLKPALRHTLFAGSTLEVESACPPLVEEVYGVLRMLATSKGAVNFPEVAQNIERWTLELARMRPQLRWIDWLLAHLNALHGGIMEREGKLVEMREEAVAHAAEVESKQSNLIAQESRNQALEGALIEGHHQLGNMAARLAQSEDKIALLSQALRNREEEVSEQKRKVESQDGKVVVLSAAISELEERISTITELAHQQKKESSAKEEYIARQDESIEKLRENLAQLEQQVVELRDELVECQRELASLNVDFTARNLELSRRESRILGLKRVLRQQGHVAKQLREQVAVQEEMIAALSESTGRQHRILQVIQSSLSWRLTRPLRFFDDSRDLL
jgi:O-antigen biosynthesis protein